MSSRALACAVAALVSAIAAAKAQTVTGSFDAAPMDQSMAAATDVAKPPLASKPRQSAVGEYRGNPLWAIALDSMSATRNRPLFSPSRRPPFIAAAVPPPQPPSKPEAPAQLQLSLVGTAIGATQSIGVFVDRDTNGVVRLRVGEGHDNWILQAIDGRKATFARDQRQVTLALPGRNRLDQQAVPLPVTAPVGRHPSALMRAQGPPPAPPSGKWAGGDGFQAAQMRPHTAQQNPPAAAWLDGNGQMVRPPK